MSEIKDGGAAFPHGEVINNSLIYEGECGMSLKQYYAAKALQGFCANPSIFAADPRCGWDLVNCTHADLVNLCNDLADALVKSQDES